jgi:hypothetical protein
MPGASFAKPGAWPSVVICRSVALINHAPRESTRKLKSESDRS